MQLNPLIKADPSKLPLTGGVLSGDLTLADSVTALQSGNYEIQMMSGVADGATAIGYIFDTVNDLATAGSEMAVWRNQGTDILHMEKAGVVVHDRMAIGSLASIDTYSSLVINETIDAPIAQKAGSLQLTMIVATTNVVPRPAAIIGKAQIDSSGVAPVLTVFDGEVAQNSTRLWTSGTIFQATASSSVAGTGGMGFVIGFECLKGTYQGGKPNTVIGMAIRDIGNTGIGTTFGIEVKKQTSSSNNYGIWLNGDGAGAETVFGVGKDASILYDGTDLVIDPDLIGTGRVLIGGTGDNDMLLNTIEIDGDLDHDGSNVGFYGTAPVAQQTGIAVTAAGIHAALVSLGLITA